MAGRRSARSKELLLSFGAVCAMSAAWGGAPAFAQEVASEDEIVVTARGREEALLDVPIAVSVVQGAEIEQQGLQDVKDLFGRLPSLWYSQNRSFSSNRDNMYLVIRGIGANPALEPSVGVFIDGVYQPGLGFEAAFLDVDRIELLRGPQGALFGRNTEGGALSIITRQPSNDVRASASLSGDDLVSMLGRASISGPIIEDRLYVGIAAQGSSTEGYIHNDYLDQSQNDETSASGRFTLRFTPDTRTDVIFTADAFGRRGSSMLSGVPESAGDTYNVAFDFDGGFEVNNAGAALTFRREFQGFDLASTTSYRAVETSYGIDFDSGFVFQGNAQFLKGEQQSYAQEIRLASTGTENFSWIVGGFLSSQLDKSNMFTLWQDYFGPPPASSNALVRVERDTVALFGQANWSTFDGFLDLTFGLRQSWESAESSRYTFLDIPAFAFTTTSTANPTPEVDYEQTSPNFQAVLNWTDNIRTYVNIAQGYKSGGWERVPTSSSPFLALQPEVATNYEAGLKGELFDGRLRFAAALYRIDVEDMHTPTLVIDPITLFPAAAIASAGEAHSQGVEIEGSLRVTESFGLSWNAAYTEAEFDSFIDTAGNNRVGDPIPNVPEFLFNLELNYHRPAFAGFDFFGDLRWRHVSEYFSGLGTNSDRRMEYPSTDLLDLDVGLQNDRFSVALFARNLTDEYVETSRAYDFDQGEILRQIGPPRVIGLRVGYNFQE